MNVVEIRASAVVKVKELVKLGKNGAAREIASIFKPDGKPSADELAFHGKLLLLTQQYASAEKVLRRAHSKHATYDVTRDLEAANLLSRTDKQYREMRAGAALARTLSFEGVETVLDVGSGGGEHALAFAAAGKRVDAIDLGRSVYFDRSAPEAQFATSTNVNFVKANFMEIEVNKAYDLVWCSHVLEHQPNPNLFLSRCLDFVEDGKWLAITVPPLKHSIVGGHVSLWNAGLLIYQLVMAGNNCSDAIVMNYGYNITVIVRKRPIDLPELDFDAGDIDRLALFFPEGCSEGFDGRMAGGVDVIPSDEISS